MGREVRSCKGLRGLNRWRQVLNLKVLSTHRNGEQFISYLVTSLSKVRCIKATLEIKWSHFDDYSVKGINNNPNPHSAFLETSLPLFPLQKRPFFLNSLALARSFLPHMPHQRNHMPSWTSGFFSPFQTPPQFSSVLSNLGFNVLQRTVGCHSNTTCGN